MFDIIGKRFRFFLLSGAVILLGIIFLAVFGLNLGIEFGSGSMMRVGFEQEVDQVQLREELANLGYETAIVLYPDRRVEQGAESRATGRSGGQVW